MVVEGLMSGRGGGPMEGIVELLAFFKRRGDGWIVWLGSGILRIGFCYV